MTGNDHNSTIEYVKPTVTELGTLEQNVQVSGLGTNLDGEIFNS